MNSLAIGYLRTQRTRIHMHSSRVRVGSHHCVVAAGLFFHGAIRFCLLHRSTNMGENASRLPVTLRSLPPRDLGRTPRPGDRPSKGLQGSGHCNKDFAEASDSIDSRHTLQILRGHGHLWFFSCFFQRPWQLNCQVLSRGVVHQPRT